MESLKLYFSSIPSLHRSLILAGGIAFFWMLEYFIPLFRFQYKKFQHAGINIFFTITTILINFLMAFILVSASDWTTRNHFGLLNWLPEIPIWLHCILGLLLLDLIGAYFVHWLEHKIKWMWRFHLIHHTDTWVDTTSANRHHPGESVFRFIFTTLGVVLIGCPIWILMLYQSMSVLLSQFNHANIIFPKWLDTTLSWVIVSPDMHKVHHHYILPYTDTNFGNIFSIWDRIFGTFATMKRSEIVFGIDTYMDPSENNNLMRLLKIPFQKYRSPTGSKFE